jgi:hypothetical protein
VDKSEPQTRNQKPETRNQKPETRNPEPRSPHNCVILSLQASVINKAVGGVMKYKVLLIAGVVLLIAAASAVPAQNGQEFTDPGGQYKLALIGDWRGVSYNDAVGRQKTEFVYRDRSEGLLKITKEPLSGSLAEMVRQEEENLKIYRAGFERSASEPFGGGNLSGIRLSFFSTEGNRKMANTFYYLQDKNTVWVLRFVGKRGSLDTVRNLTDQIARSFRAT